MKRKTFPRTFNIFILLFVLLIALLSFFYLLDDDKKTLGTSAPSKTEVSTDQKIEATQETPINQIGENKKEVPDMPILMYHHIRTVNDQSDQIGVNLSVDPQDFVKQLDLISSNGYTTTNFNDILSGNLPAKPIILTFDDGYNNFYSDAYPDLKKRKMKAVAYIIYNDVGQNDYMNENQIKEISQNNIEIGSHTLSHPDLTKISNEKVSAELLQSKGKLEAMLGIKVISLCYPSGKVNDIVEAMAKSIGYDFAVTTNSKITDFSDPLMLNRYRVNHDTNISTYIK